MSRSFKHTPVCSYRHHGYKKIANHYIRHTVLINNFSYYKKLYCSYNICDYKSYFDISRLKRYIHSKFKHYEIWEIGRRMTRETYYRDFIRK